MPSKASFHTKTRFRNKTRRLLVAGFEVGGGVTVVTATSTTEPVAGKAAGFSRNGVLV